MQAALVATHAVFAEEAKIGRDRHRVIGPQRRCTCVAHTQRLSRCANTIFVASMSTVALNWCCIACILRCKSAAVSVHIRGDTRVGWRALYTVCRLYKGDTVQPRQRVRSGRSVLVHLTASHTAETPWRRRLPVVAFEGPSAHTTRTGAPRTEPERDMPAAAAQHAPCTEG